MAVPQHMTGIRVPDATGEVTEYTNAESTPSGAEAQSEKSNITARDAQDKLDEQQLISTMETLSTTSKVKRPKTLTEFTIFGKLPAEIRLLIWKTAAHQPRIIELTGRGRFEFSPSAGDYGYVERDNTTFLGGSSIRQETIRFTCEAPVPSILQVNLEARKEGLKYYRPYFGLNGFEPRIYFNNISDIILLREWSVWELCEKETHDAHREGIKEVFKSVLNLSLRQWYGQQALEKKDEEFKRLLSDFPNITFLLFLQGNCISQMPLLCQWFPPEKTDVICRYQQKVLVKAVKKCCGSDRKPPTVEIAFVK